MVVCGGKTCPAPIIPSWKDQIRDNWRTNINNNTNRLYPLKKKENPCVYSSVNKKINKWGEKKAFFCQSSMPTNKCTRNDRIRKSPFGRHHSNN